MSIQPSLELALRGTNKDAVLISTNNGQAKDKSLLDDEGVTGLRQRLKLLGVWPDAADQFLALMPHSRWQNAPLLETDYQWVSLVVEDSVKGVDIGANYPAFFQKLLSSSELRQTFLSALSARLDAT